MAGLPPNVQSGLMYPDLQQQMLQLQNSQNFANNLMQGGEQPQGQNVGGVYIPPSFTQQLARAIRGPVGAYMTKQNIQKSADLNVAQGQRYADMLRNVVPQGGSFKDQTIPTAEERQLYNQWMGQKLVGNEVEAEKTWQAIMDRKGLTTNQKEWAVQGVDPRHLAGGTLRENAGKGFVDVKPGTPVFDPQARQVVAYAPKTGEGVGLTFNGGMPSGSYQVPGYAGANANIQGAEQGAKTANSIFNVTMPDGSQVPVLGGSLGAGAPHGPAGAPGAPATPMGGSSPVSQVSQPAARGNGAPAQNPPAAPQNKLKLGQSTTDRELQVAGGQKIAALPQIAVQSKQTVAGLESALNTLQQSGPGLKGRVNVEALLQNWGLPVGKAETENFQTLQKFLNNALATAASATGANGSDARFEQFLHGQPNADTMNAPALDKAIRYVLSQHDAAQVAAKYQMDAYKKARAEGDANAAQTAQQKWSEVYDPRVFEFSRMSPKQRQQFRSSMSKDQQAQFGARYNQAHSMGWVQ